MAMMRLKDVGDETVHLSEFRAVPQHHGAATRLGQLVSCELDEGGVQATLTCRAKLVPLYENWGFRHTGWTTEWVFPGRLARVATMRRVVGGGGPSECP